MSDMFVAWIAGVACFMAALERPDRQTFWLGCLYFSGASLLLTGLTS